MADVSISYKNTEIATMNATGVKTLLTGDCFCEDDIVVAYTKPAAPTPTLETITKTYTPTTSQQTETLTAGAGYDAIGEVDVTVNAMPSGTAGTPTATKGTVTNHSVSVTPSVTNTTGYITGGTKSGTAVTVSASELVSGTLSITENGTVDVTNYASVEINVSGGGSNMLDLYTSSAAISSISASTLYVDSTRTTSLMDYYNYDRSEWYSDFQNHDIIRIIYQSNSTPYTLYVVNFSYDNVEDESKIVIATTTGVRYFTF